MDKKDIRKLVDLYFQYNPSKNRGVAWRAKAYDIISGYATGDKKTYEEIAECIEKYPGTGMPIWTQFENHFSSINKKKIENENSDYRNSINNSTDVNDWL